MKSLAAFMPCRIGRSLYGSCGVAEHEIHPRGPEGYRTGGRRFFSCRAGNSGSEGYAEGESAELRPSAFVPLVQHRINLPGMIQWGLAMSCGLRGDFQDSFLGEL